jgi:hypothetical protein
MLEPLKQWICDVCGKLIETPEDGYVIWSDDKNSHYADFKIIHQGQCDKTPTSGSMSVPEFLGDNGCSNLLSFLSKGLIRVNHTEVPSTISPANIDDFVDLFRRLQTPFYEEARIHFDNSELFQEFREENDRYVYSEKNLRQIIKRYGEYHVQ